MSQTTNVSNFPLDTDNLVTEINRINDTLSTLPVSLFDVKWSDHRINDMSWLRSDTFSWQNGNVYTAAYNELLNEYENRSDQTVYKAFAKANYTAVGSNIKEWRGIVQGFNGTTDYITHPVVQPTSSMEYVLKVYQNTANPNVALSHRIDNGYSVAINIESTSIIKLYVSTNGTSWNIANGAIVGTLPTNTWKWLKLIWNGSVLTMSESLDGVSYTQIYSVTCTSAPKYVDSNQALGGYSGGAAAFATGKFDLKECYFKADGNLVWSGADFIEYVITDKKYRIALPSQAEKIKQSYDDYGIAWYYILDSTNTRFKLPRTKFGFTGLRSGVGEFVEAGLPNIEGSLNWGNGTVNVRDGAFISKTMSMSGVTAASATLSSIVAFDASASNPIYSNSDTVQPPATEMYLYHYVGKFNRDTVLATIGVTSENIGSTSFLNTPVGTIIWSMANSVPSGYLLCNGQAVGRLAYPELFSAIGTTYGEGDGDSTFNLPDLIGKFVEGNATAGIEHEAGLPNIEGELESAFLGSPTAKNNKALSWSGGSSSRTVSAGTGWAFNGSLTFNASDYNPIYGDSDTVQPSSLTAMPCIKAFDAVVNDGTVDVAELVSNTLRLDGTNVGSIGNTLNEYLAHAAMPSEQYIDLTLGASSSTYTAPADGWFAFNKDGSQGQWAYIGLVDAVIGTRKLVSGDRGSGVSCGILYPVKKGDVIAIHYTTTGTLYEFRFYYAEGSVPTV